MSLWRVVITDPFHVLFTVMRPPFNELHREGREKPDQGWVRIGAAALKMVPWVGLMDRRVRDGVVVVDKLKCLITSIGILADLVQDLALLSPRICVQ